MKAPLKRRVLLDVLLIFVQSGRANGPQLTTRQRRLQYVRGVHRSFRCAGSDQRMQFINKQDYLAFRLCNFFQYRLQPLFKFSTEFRAGNQRGQVERNQPFGLQHVRHIAGDNALGQALDDGRLTHPRLAD